MTIAVAKVLSVLLEEPGGHRYGLELMAATGLPSGMIYPIMRRLQDAGWVTSDWERIDPATEGRPARRYYQLTPEGADLARAALADVRAATAPRRGSGVRRPRSAW